MSSDLQPDNSSSKRTCCRQCGYELDEGNGTPIPDPVKCPSCGLVSDRDSLIGDMDDYWWCQ